MGSDHNIDIKYLCNRVLTGNITNDEKNDLHQYIQQYYQNNDLDDLMREYWLELGKRLDQEDAYFLSLKRLTLSRINITKELEKKEYIFFSSKLRSSLIRVAAMLFIPLLIASLSMIYIMERAVNRSNNPIATQEIVASPGSRVHCTLPDKTEVWLNSESTLQFSTNLNQQNERKVKLKGQGYFKVFHDKKHPFIVEVEEISVKALGTSFDVSGYNDNKEISSTLEEGSIALLNANGTELTRLVPGQKAVLNKVTRKIVVGNVETALTTSWKDGKLIFRQTSLLDVVKQLERWYNCNIHIDNQLLNSGFFYTGTIQDETLGEVLKMIELSTSVKTRIEKREVYIENTK